MRDYELAFIIRPSVEGDDVTAVIDKVSGYVGAINGEVASVDVWGRKQLAYPINKVHKAHYILMNIECDADTLNNRPQEDSPAPDHEDPHRGNDRHQYQYEQAFIRESGQG